MDVILKNLTDSLGSALERYNSIIDNRHFSYNDWSKNKELLSPIVLQLREQAETRIEFCENKIEISNKKQVSTLEKRSALYNELNSGKEQLSELDLKKIKIVEEIALLSKEIEDNNKKIAECQNVIAKAKKESEYWNTVFWATCWIPFVSIGTSIKSEVEEGKYYAAARVLGNDIWTKQNKIKELNKSFQEVSTKQVKNNESSGMLANQITVVEGGVAAVTNLINDLRREVKLWQAILITCSEIDVELQYANGNIKIVMESFGRLMEVEKLFVLPTTDKYIRGRLCRGETICVGQILNQNTYLISRNRRFVAIMQEDNNFVVYNSEKPLWDSKTWGAKGNGYVELSHDGLVSLKGIDRNWNTKRDGAVVLIMQDDGNLVTYDKNNKALWATDTYIYANEPSIYFISS